MDARRPMRTLWVAVVAVVVAGCASPPAAAPRKPIDPDATPDVEATGPARFTYDWDARRAAYEPRTAGPWPDSPCNTAARAPSTMPGFAYPKGPSNMAALVVRRLRVDEGTRLFLDRGTRDGVDETWSGVLLDERGHALHAWTCLRMGFDNLAVLVVPLPLTAVRRHTHVALFQDPPR